MLDVRDAGSHPSPGGLLRYQLPATGHDSGTACGLKPANRETRFYTIAFEQRVEHIDGLVRTRRAPRRTAVLVFCRRCAVIETSGRSGGAWNLHTVVQLARAPRLQRRTSETISLLFTPMMIFSQKNRREFTDKF